MNEELKQRLEKLERENQELLNWKKSLESSHSIPLNIDQSFRTRLLTAPVIKASAKGNNSEDQAVNEAGSGSYNVLKEADDFLEVQLVAGGTIYYIPVYNALT